MSGVVITYLWQPSGVVILFVKRLRHVHAQKWKSYYGLPPHSCHKNLTCKKNNKVEGGDKKDIAQMTDAGLWWCNLIIYTRSHPTSLVIAEVVLYQGIIDPTGTETFAKEPKFAKIIERPKVAQEQICRVSVLLGSVTPWAIQENVKTKTKIFSKFLHPYIE